MSGDNYGNGKVFNGIVNFDNYGNNCVFNSVMNSDNYGSYCVFNRTMNGDNYGSNCVFNAAMNGQDNGNHNVTSGGGVSVTVGGGNVRSINTIRRSDRNIENVGVYNKVVTGDAVVYTDNSGSKYNFGSGMTMHGSVMGNNTITTMTDDSKVITQAGDTGDIIVDNVFIRRNGYNLYLDDIYYRLTDYDQTFYSPRSRNMTVVARRGYVTVYI